METWNIIWIGVLILAFFAFLLISTKVIARGFSEMRELLKNLN